MSAEQNRKRGALGSVRSMPGREELRNRPDSVDPASVPGAVPWAQFPAAGPEVRTVPEACVNFTLPGGGAVLMSLPTTLSVADAVFAASVIGEFITALADRMKKP